MKINFIMHLQNYRNLRIVLFFILLLFGSILPNQLLGQKNDVPSKGKLKRETKKGHKSTDKSNAETVDVSEELRRLHRSNQTKSTRKRMKRNMKKANVIMTTKETFLPFVGGDLPPNYLEKPLERKNNKFGFRC